MSVTWTACVGGELRTAVTCPGSEWVSGGANAAVGIRTNDGHESMHLVRWPLASSQTRWKPPGDGGTVHVRVNLHMPNVPG